MNAPSSTTGGRQFDRLFLAAGQQMGPDVEISGREAHHGLHVLRLRRGEMVTVLDGAGGERVCEVSAAERHTLRLEVKETHRHERAPYAVTLFQALPKGKAFEMILQKAAELGAYRIVPLITERVVPQVEKDAAKLDKWNWVMIDALKQCGNPWLPILEPPQKFGDAVRGAKDFDLSLVGSLHEGRRHPREWFQSLARKPRSVATWVGPEGDFTPTEMEALMGAGVKPMSLGRLVLRSDTAAICSLAIVNYELDAP